VAIGNGGGGGKRVDGPAGGGPVGGAWGWFQAGGKVNGEGPTGGWELWAAAAKTSPNDASGLR
jgi:hypothetical protein